MIAYSCTSVKIQSTNAVVTSYTRNAMKKLKNAMESHFLINSILVIYKNNDYFNLEEKIRTQYMNVATVGYTQYNSNGKTNIFMKYKTIERKRTNHKSQPINCRTQIEESRTNIRKLNCTLIVTFC